MKNKVLFLLLTLFSCVFAQNRDENKLSKTLDDDNSKYTNVGNLGLTVTNFGQFGNLFKSPWPAQPNCEYPLGSGIEHIYRGGLWVGGYANGRYLVSTGSIDNTSVEGIEYTNQPGDKIVERSSLLTSRNYSPDAISHQDLISDYVDTNTTTLSGETIENHNPLGIAVHEENYAWNFPFADFFVIKNYTIKNVSNHTIDSVYAGLWAETVVRNTKVTSPSTGASFFNKGGNGYSDSLKVAYEYDKTGDPGLTDSYIGMQFLGSEYKLNPGDSVPAVNFVVFEYQGTDPKYFSPGNEDDVTKYWKMQGFFDAGRSRRYGHGPNDVDPAKETSARPFTTLITSGPYTTLAPGDSINVVFAIVCAKKWGSDPASLDSVWQRKNLYDNAEWALRAYYGEDRNRNGLLDAGEDIDANGKITRYILPSPPAVPIVKVVPESNKATIYWDKRAEATIDPISGKQDFEGYKIYRTQAGYDLAATQNNLASLVLLAEFDSTGNDIGYNTGFDYVRLQEPVTFPNDTIQYYYKYEVDNLLNGWQYLFSVTGFDEGDADNNLSSLESSALANMKKVFPGTVAADDDNTEVGVYPNPYYGSAIWDGSSERLRKINFFNLPSDCEITIYTLAGDIVKKLEHNSNNSGADIRWFENYSAGGSQQFAGGEHAWDLITDNDQAIASGLYLFTVKNNKTGNIKTGKFLIVK